MTTRRQSTLGSKVRLGLAVLLFASFARTDAGESLDGMRFSGMFGPAGKPGDVADTMYFAGGKFWTQKCLPCGFLPGPYRIERSGSELRFSGELSSAEKGRLHYDGVLRGNRLSAKVKWRKERWYWMIDRDFLFEGEFAGQTPAAAERAAVGLAAAAGAGGSTGDCRM